LDSDAPEKTEQITAFHNGMKMTFAEPGRGLFYAPETAFFNHQGTKITKKSHQGSLCATLESLEPSWLDLFDGRAIAEPVVEVALPGFDGPVTWKQNVGKIHIEFPAGAAMHHASRLFAAHR
jgi:hypothetical protein